MLSEERKPHTFWTLDRKPTRQKWSEDLKAHLWTWFTFGAYNGNHTPENGTSGEEQLCGRKLVSFIDFPSWPPFFGIFSDVILFTSFLPKKETNFVFFLFSGDS